MKISAYRSKFFILGPLCILSFAAAHLHGQASLDLARAKLLKEMADQGWEVAEKKEKIPTIEVEKISGGSWVTDNTGAKVSLINVFSVYCPHCQAEVESLKSFYEKVKGKAITFATISIVGGKKATVDFVATHSINYPVFFDTEQKFMKSLKIEAIPHAILIDSDGTILATKEGEFGWDAGEFMVPLLEYVARLAHR